MLRNEYDIRKLTHFPLNATVGEVVEELKKCPPEASFCCCGSDTIFLHITPDRMMVNLDSEPLEDLYFGTSACELCGDDIFPQYGELPVYVNLGMLTEYVVCPQCFEEHRDGLIACPHCGEWYEQDSIPADLISCPFCGADWEATD